MKILGISGFENSMPFKRAHWPGLEEREYRISQAQAAAAALVTDGVAVAAAAEERFNRQKDSARFPAGAIRFCLAEAGLSLQDIDQIAHGFDYAPYGKIYAIDSTTAKLYWRGFSTEAPLALVERDLLGFPEERVHHVNHHLPPPPRAYFPSPGGECPVLLPYRIGEAHT